MRMFVGYSGDRSAISMCDWRRASVTSGRRVNDAEQNYHGRPFAPLAYASWGSALFAGTECARSPAHVARIGQDDWGETGGTEREKYEEI